MMQGETLNADIAECGSLYSMPGMTEVPTTYVILSRIKQAESLLLLRAFSPKPLPLRLSTRTCVHDQTLAKTNWHFERI